MLPKNVSSSDIIKTVSAKRIEADKLRVDDVVIGHHDNCGHHGQLVVDSRAKFLDTVKFCETSSI